MKFLNALCERRGIESSFVDARGEIRTTSDATKRALLKAMGVSDLDEKSLQASLAELERDEWLVPLASTCVLVPDGPLGVTITLAAGTGRVRWRLRLEDGTERHGETRFDSLPLLGVRKIGPARMERRSLSLEGNLPLGYHRLMLLPDSECTLIVSPGRCWLPEALDEGAKLWGVAAQLYLLRSEPNWGIGDLSDLRRLAQMLHPQGAHVIGLNPLHAMFPDEPERASPYSPASRLLLNVLYIDVAAVVQEYGSPQTLEIIRSESFEQELATARAASLVDYTRVTRLKLDILRLVYDHLEERPDKSRDLEFERFRQAAGPTFERHCLFMALREHFSTVASGSADWRGWPVAYRNPDSAEVADFARTRSRAVAFQAWLQYLADGQLAQAAAAAAPMAIGIYRDLAVGADPSGAETWANQRAVIDAAHVGCPPDIYNPAGQDWGLPPFLPMALKKGGYQSFIELLRANMRHAGALRIDHVMALQQLYWVPQGLSAAEGAYIRYPLEDLVGIVALESHRNQCLVVGEDLGTVPAGFRERMTQARILSYRVLFFEKADEGFLEPDQYPPLSLAVAGSHDLPTLSAWMAGSDLTLKKKLGLFPTPELYQGAVTGRAIDRADLLSSFRKQGLGESFTDREFADAAHVFLARTASAITMVQMDDLTHEGTPVNVPATSEEHPNWRRRLSMSLEEIASDPHIGGLSRSMTTARAGHPSHSPTWTKQSV